MTLGNRQDPCRQEKVHYKMYKDGKQWVVAGLFSAFIATGLLTQPVQATTSTTATTSTNQVAQSQADSAAALQAKAVPQRPVQQLHRKIARQRPVLLLLK